MERFRQFLTRLLSSVHSESFFRLVITGFSLVALPLVIALVTGVFYLNKLTHQSQEAVSRAVLATQGSRQLLEITAAMERNLRQYLVLGDEQVYQRYLDRHTAFISVSDLLSERLVDETQREQLVSLINLELSLFDRLQENLNTGQMGRVEPMEYVALTSLARSILRDNNNLIDSEVRIMSEISADAKNVIFWELVAVLPAVAIFIVFFAFLLSRPIRQLDQGIRKLGNGEFDHEIQVSGPRDLEYLGERLNWLRTRLKYLEDKKSKFLHHASHELKTPLSAIREGSELLADRVTGPLNDRQKEVCEILRKNSISLQQMIEKLLSFNLPGEAHDMRQLKPILLHHLLETVIADHKPVILSKNIGITVRCDDVRFQGDEEQLRVIIDNLISNAVKFVPEGGEINIQLVQQDDLIILDIEDSGSGVNESDRGNIFNKFYKGKSDGSSVIQGSGLGLAIVDEFVKAHDGTIELLERSEELSGAHFRVRLPCDRSDKNMKWAV